MRAVEVDGDSLDLPSDLFGTDSQGGTIIDSGTTLAYLPDEIYEPLMEKVGLILQTLRIHFILKLRIDTA